METLYDSICNLTKIGFIGFCNEFESSEYYQPIMELIREAANKGKDEVSICILTKDYEKFYPENCPEKYVIAKDRLHLDCLFEDAQLYFYGNGFKAWVSNKSSTKGTLCIKWINPIRKNCINGDEN